MACTFLVYNIENRGVSSPSQQPNMMMQGLGGVIRRGRRLVQEGKRGIGTYVISSKKGHIQRRQ